MISPSTSFRPTAAESCRHWEFTYESTWNKRSPTLGTPPINRRHELCGQGDDRATIATPRMADLLDTPRLLEIGGCRIHQLVATVHPTLVRSSRGCCDGVAIHWLWFGPVVPYIRAPDPGQREELCGPRDFLRQPDLFGRRVDAEWKSNDPADRAQVAAAYYQHLAACEALRVAGEKDWGISELAAEIGVNPDTLRRKLYGEGPAAIDDITGWALAVEAVTVLPAPADVGRMLHPS